MSLGKKEAFIIPSGGHTLADNYHFISFISYCCQFTASNLPHFTNVMVNCLNSRLEVHTIYTDFTKAFYTVNCKILPSLSVPISLVTWLHSIFPICRISFDGPFLPPLTSHKALFFASYYFYSLSTLILVSDCSMTPTLNDFPLYRCLWTVPPYNQI